MKSGINEHQQGKVRILPYSQRTINVLGCQDINENTKVLMTDDPRACFTFVRDVDKAVGNVEFTPLDRVDYNIKLPAHATGECKDTVFEHKGMPLSFLSVKSLEEGEAWYRRNSRYPDEIIPILARYQFGDLRTRFNKKAAKNDKRRTKKDKTKRDKVGYHVTRENTILNFD